ncbi:MAG TPA: TIGR02147 family protein, partial [Bdellovibrionota bacterium]|nr:TIGR02147 family protein [Bdellovibrionota bacterium]
KISKKDAAESLQVLQNLGMLQRDPTGKLVPAEPIVNFAGGFFREITQKFHIEMMERAKEAMLEDEYEERNASSLTLSCERALLPDIKKAIDDFRTHLNVSFGLPTAKADSVIQVCFQIFQHTPTKKGKASRAQGSRTGETP